MKRMKKYLSMAALALVGAVMTGCSNNDNAVLPVSYDNVQQPVNNEKIVTLKTTISLDNNNATTRALAVDFDQKKAIKTFAEGDEMAVIYKNTNNETMKAVGTLTDGAGTASATFTFTLTDPDNTKAIRYIYPAAMAKDVATDATIDDAGTVDYDKLNNQDGTLATLGSNLDLCTLDAASWTSGTLPTGTLENQLAILAITLKNADGSSDINNTITSMVVSDGTNSYTVNRTAAAGPIYVAILPTSGATIDVIATDGTKYYAKSLSNKTYEVSKGYNVTWLMPEVADLDLSMLDCAGNLRPRSTANCYMVHTAGYYMLPLVYGNAIKNGTTNAAAYTGIENEKTTLTFPRHDGSAITDPWIKDNGITVTTAVLLWQDATGLVTAVGIDGDYLTLTVGKNAAAQEGNAVVAAKDGSGNIVWSWHIWVTKQTFAAADLTTVATGSHNYTVTPVNLGWVGDAVSQGYNTYYQWGRKDPFPGMGSVTYSTSSATIADNIKNPTTFYNVSNNPNTSTAYNLWDAQQKGTGNIATATKKTVYDPCPAGFCVPTGNLYYYMNGGVTFDWDDTNKGRNLTSVTPNVFFPAAGYRNYSSGAPIGHVGSHGYYWSSSASGDDSARRLHISSANFAWDLNYRARGFSVRPVAEE